MADNNKLKFLRGTQAELNQLETSAIIDGAFYLTTDSKKLYYGSNGEVYPLNNTIAVVKTTDDLTTAQPDEAASFYYVTDSRIFAFWNGSSWVQVNPDTNYYLTKLAFSASATKVDNSVVDNSVTIDLLATLSNKDEINDDFIIQGANGVEVSASGDTVTIAGTTYALDVTQGSNNDVSINLNSSGAVEDSDTVKIVGGTGIFVTEEPDESIKISINEKALSGVTAVAFSNDTGDETSPAEGFHLTVTTAKGDPVATNDDTKLDPIISVIDSYDDQGNESRINKHFSDSIAELPVYSKDYIDNKFSALNAMHYMGTVSSYSELPTVNVNAGDTYRASADIKKVTTDSNYFATKGDLIIAKNDVGADGTVTWEVIEIEMEIEDSQYIGFAIDNGMTIKGSNGNDKDETIASLSIQAGAGINVTDSANNGADSNIITIAHADTSNYSASTIQDEDIQDAKETMTFKVIKKVNVDAYGHITGIDTADVTVRDTNISISGVSHEVTAANNVATITTTVAANDGAGNAMTITQGTFAISANHTNLTVTETTDISNNIQLDLVWGTFGASNA